MFELEMTVDDVKKSDKSGNVVSYLKGTLNVEGVKVPVLMNATCSASDILEVLGIDQMRKQINIEISKGAQQLLEVE